MSKTIKLALMLTALTVSSVAQTPIIPIVDLRTGGLFGGVLNGKWISAAKTASQIKPKTEFALAGWNGVEEGGVSLADFNGETEVCGDHWSFSFELEMHNGVGIGTAAKWDPVPRKAVKIPISNAVYRKVVADFLKSKGFKDPTVEIKQIYKIDLDGNGTDEVLISATRYRSGMYESQQPGDYSFTLLRTASGKTAVNHLLEGEFYPGRITKELWPPNVYEFTGVADLNGDGIMEILVGSQYYEGGTNGAFEIKAGKPVKIKEFEIGCGL